MTGSPYLLFTDVTRDLVLKWQQGKGVSTYLEVRGCASACVRACLRACVRAEWSGYTPTPADKLPNPLTPPHLLACPHPCAQHAGCYSDKAYCAALKSKFVAVGVWCAGVSGCTCVRMCVGLVGPEGGLRACFHHGNRLLMELGMPSFTFTSFKLGANGMSTEPGSGLLIMAEQGERQITR
jgi:hypothetical protein